MKMDIYKTVRTVLWRCQEVEEIDHPETEPDGERPKVSDDQT
jgi:hypothetical protein